MTDTLQGASGARESNAGDEFHFRWTARRALSLLDPKSGLVRLGIERAEPWEIEGLKFLAVDTSEYYGGNDIHTADRVIANQLKYSSASKLEPWTASRLATGRARSRPSIIHRLAETLKDFTALAGRVAVIQKVKLRLVSNQPADPKLVDALNDAHNVLAKLGTKPIKYEAFRQQLQPSSSSHIDRLQQGLSSLDDKEFTDFLRVLDLSGCGEASLEGQDALILQDGGLMLGVGAAGALQGLVDIVRELALPKHKGSPGLYEADVITALGVSDRDNLLPAPPILESPAKVIKTEDPKNVATLLQDNQRVLAHGVAGIGKTTTTQQIAGFLPKNSVVSIFDCWGGGASKSFGETRHSTASFVAQMANQLAAQVGVAPLIPGQDSIDQLSTRFKKRVRHIAEIIDQESGILVLVVDAADNAVAAAQKNASETFVQFLWTMELPKNCRLLMTSRTARKELLGAPDNVSEYELRGFDVSASSTHLRTRFESATDEEGAAFHSVTGGIPRLQDYKLSRFAGEPNGFADVLSKRHGKLDDLFADIVEAALTEVSAKATRRGLLAGLLCMSSPLETGAFAESHELSIDEARSFLSGLVPGLLIKRDSVIIRDEDFDDYLQKIVSDQERANAHGRLASFYLGGELASPYAARAIAEHLYLANRTDDLVSLAMSNRGLSAIRDELLRTQVKRVRLQYALQLAAREKHRVRVVQLLMLSADAVKSDFAHTTLVKENAELAAKFGDAEAVGQILLKSDSEPWYGPAHYRAAAICSRDSDGRDSARKHLESGDSWIRAYFSRNEQDRFRWDFDAQDIARCIEAHYHLNGMSESLRQAFRWSPLQFLESVVENFAKSLAKQLPPDTISEDLLGIARAPWIDLVFVAAFWREGKLLNTELVERATEAALRRSSKRNPRAPSSTVVELAEARSQARLSATTTQRLLRLRGPRSTDAMSPYGRDFEPLVRACALVAELTGQEITVEDIWPPSPAKSGQQVPHYSDDTSTAGQLRSRVRPLLTAYKLQAKQILGATVESLTSQVSSELEERLKFSRSQERGGRSESTAQWALASFQLLAANSVVDDLLLNEIINGTKEILKNSVVEVQLQFAEIAARYARVGLSTRILETARTDIQLLQVPARERVKYLVSGAETALRFSTGLSSDLFALATEVAQSVDDDSNKFLWASLLVAAGGSSRTTVQRNRREYAARFLRLIELYEPYSSDREYFPILSMLRTSAVLCADSAIVAAARWDALGFEGLNRSLPPLLVELVKLGRCDAQTGLTLLRLVESHSRSLYFGLNILEELKEQDPELTALCTQEIVYQWESEPTVSDNSDDLEKLLAWLAVNSAGSKEHERLLRIAKLRRASSNESDGSELRAWSQSQPGRSHQQSLSDVLLQIDLSKPDQIASHFSDYCEKAFNESDLARFIEHISGIAYDSRVEVLLSIASVESTRYKGALVARALRLLYNEWSGANSVRNIMPQVVKMFLQHHANDFNHYYFEDTNELWSLISLAGPDLNAAQALVESSFANLERCRLFDLLGAAVELSKGLSDAEHEEFLLWMLGNLDTHLSESTAATPVFDRQEPDEWFGTLADLLWHCMGDPSRAIRWKTVRAARILLKRHGESLASRLWAKLTCPSDGPLSADQVFFEMSATSMLLVLAQRLADEVPDVVEVTRDRLIEIATSTEFPHAQIRELAKQTLLTLATKGMQLHPLEHDRVNLANQPKSCYVERGERFNRRGRRTRPEDLRFSIDSMDTIPYWVDPVDDVFDMPDPDAAKRVDRWITDAWGFTDEDARRYRDRHSDDQWRLSYNHHGTIPKVENLRKYLEYHGVLCAAGEMADEGHPIRASEWRGDRDPWLDLLDDHLPLSWDFWLGDLKRSVPAEDDFWRSLRVTDSWLDEKCDSEFIAQLGLEQCDGEVVIDSDVRIETYSGSQSTAVECTLVTPKVARAAALSIQNAGWGDYYFPIENVRDDVRERGFHLTSMVGHEDIGSCLDAHDPSADEKPSCFVGLHSKLRAVLVEELTPSGRMYREEGGQTVARWEWWDSRDERNNGERRGVNGHRLWINREWLASFLHREKMTLLIAVRIGRNSNRSSRGDRKYDLGTSRAFLVTRNGKIQGPF